MEINLKQINNKLIIKRLKSVGNNELPFIIQYADFNVLNYFYENNYSIDELKYFLLYPDSSAVYFFIKYFQKKTYKIIVSTDLQNSFLQEIAQNKLSLFLFGDSKDILKRAKENILLEYSNIQVVGACDGYNFNTKKLITEINKNKIDILFVGLGVGRQEKWILGNYKKLNVKIIMSVGGWFQYLAKNKKRAPLFLRRLHLEWLHKIIVEFPRVWKRYFIGLPKFFYRVLTKKILIKIENE